MKCQAFYITHQLAQELANHRARQTRMASEFCKARQNNGDLVTNDPETGEIVILKSGGGVFRFNP